MKIDPPNFESPRFDPKKRAAEKQRARARDAADLAAGRVSPRALSRRNALFGAVDFSKVRLATPLPKPTRSQSRRAKKD